MSDLPSISSYGQGSGDTGNTLQVELPNGLRIYYSYKTIVAFYTPESGLVVSENVWSNTTGKHLSWIDGGEKSKRELRKPNAGFNELLQNALAGDGEEIPEVYEIVMACMEHPNLDLEFMRRLAGILYLYDYRELKHPSFQTIIVVSDHDPWLQYKTKE